MNSKVGRLIVRKMGPTALGRHGRLGPRSAKSMLLCSTGFFSWIRIFLDRRTRHQHKKVPGRRRLRPLAFACVRARARCRRSRARTARPAAHNCCARLAHRSAAGAPVSHAAHRARSALALAGGPRLAKAPHARCTVRLTCAAPSCLLSLRLHTSNHGEEEC